MKQTYNSLWKGMCAATVSDNCKYHVKIGGNHQVLQVD